VIKKNQNPSPRLGKLVFPRLYKLLELSILFCKNAFPLSIIWELGLALSSPPE